MLCGAINQNQEVFSGLYFHDLKSSRFLFLSLKALMQTFVFICHIMSLAEHHDPKLHRKLVHVIIAGLKTRMRIKVWNH